MPPRRRQQPQQQPRYQEALRHATVDVVQQQAKAGIDIVNDGEYGKSSWANYVLDRMTGFESAARHDLRSGLARARSIPLRGVHEGRVPARRRRRARACLRRTDQRIRVTRPSAATSATSRLRSRRAGVAEGFLTAVAPASTGYDASNEYYKDERDYVFAIADALREEYLEIVNAGLVLQVDDAVLANMYDELIAAEPRRGTGNGPSCAWRRSITRCAAFRKIACDTTSALEAGTSRTWPMPRSRPSSRSC